jgi:hypothetical protein
VRCAVGVGGMSAHPNCRTDDCCQTCDPPATAIEPLRVMVLNEDEQRELLSIMREFVENPFQPPSHPLYNRIAYGDEYEDEMDELARTTLRKRRLEAEIKRCNMTIERLTEPVVERLAEIGAKSLTHEGSSTRIQRDDAVRLTYADPDWGKDEQALARSMSGEIMEQLGDEYAAFIVPTYNANTVAAHFRERYKARLAEELDKPEAERQPVNADDVLPEPLREWLSLSVKPRVKVTAV